MTAKIRLAEPFEPVALPKEAVSVSVAHTLDDLMQVMAIRSVVYMGEQLCPYDEEFDGNDLAGATHLIARIGSQPVGVIRLRWFCDFAKLERLTVMPHCRGGKQVRPRPARSGVRAGRQEGATARSWGTPRCAWRRC